MTVDAATLYALARRALTGPLLDALALDAALARARPPELLKLSTVVREPWRQSEPWPVIDRARLTTLDPTMPEDAALLCAASLDRDGFVRELAVRALVRFAPPHARRFLWMRLDDVVPAIATRADEALDVSAMTLDALVGDLGLLEQLAVRERARRRSSLVTALRTLASNDPAVRAALRRGLSAPDAEVRSACARRLAGEGDDAVRIEAIRTALRDPSPRVHLWAAREAALRKTAPAVAAAVAPAMCAHDEPSVRLRGVRILARDDETHEALLAATIDVDASVRFEARAAVVRGGAFDHRAVALDALGEGGPEAWPDARRALGALGAMYDVGQRDDWPLVARYLAHPRTRVQAEALRALASLAPDLFVDVFVAKLRHRSRRVARESVTALERCAQGLGAVTFRAVVSDATLRALADDGALREPVRIAARRFLKARSAKN